MKKGFLRNFTKLTGKHLCQSLFFNKVAGLGCFPVNFVKFLRTPSFIERLWMTASLLQNIEIFERPSGEK